MTGEEFRARYRLLKQVTEGSVRTHHALASTGAMVMAHFLDDSEKSRSVLGLVERQDPAMRQKVLETTEVDGVPVVVTRFILEFESLERWLRADAAEPAAPGPEPASAGSPQAPGDFTRLFRAPALPPEARPPASPEPSPPAAAPAPPRAPAPPAEPAGSGFTGLFRAIPVGSEVLAAPAASPRSAVPPPAVEEEGPATGEAPSAIEAPPLLQPPSGEKATAPPELPTLPAPPAAPRSGGSNQASMRDDPASPPRSAPPASAAPDSPPLRLDAPRYGADDPDAYLRNLRPSEPPRREPPPPTAAPFPAATPPSSGYGSPPPLSFSHPAAPPPRRVTHAPPLPVASRKPLLAGLVIVVLLAAALVLALALTR